MKARIVVLFGLVASLGVTDVFARQWYIEPEVFVSVGHEDNPFLVADDEVVEGELVDESPRNQNLSFFGGNIRLGSETETDLIAFDAAADARRYDDSILDTERIVAAFLYEKMGQAHDWGIGAGYIDSTSISSFISDPTGGSSFDDFGRFRDDVDQQQVYIRPTLRSRFSESWLGDFSFNYRDVSFDEPLDTSVEYEDFRLSAEIRRVLSERVSILAVTDILFYRPTETVDLSELQEQDAADLQLGLDYNYSENFTLFFSAGPGYVKSYVSDFGGTREFSDTTPIYNAGIRYGGQRNTYEVRFYNGFESFDDGGISKTERLTFVYSRPETFGGELGVTFSYLTRDPYTGDLTEREYFGIAPIISWDINRNLSIWTSAEYREEKRSDIATGASENADSAAFFIGLRYGWGRKLLKN